MTDSAAGPGRALPREGVRPAGHGGARSGLRLSLGGFSHGETPVLGPIELRVAPGETVALLGPSGIGKTTLLRIAAGLQAAPCTVERPERLAMVFQEPTLLPWRTALRNVALVAGVGEDAALAALAEVGLADRGDAFPRQLSLGQQRRLALARAFAARPDLVLMDEPFASLDEATRDDMLALTSRLLRGSGAAALLVTHSGAEAAMADRTLVLEGRPALLHPGPGPAATPTTGQ